LTNPISDPTNKLPKTDSEENAPNDGKEVKKVVVGKVTRRKKPLGKRFMETFVGGDAKSVAQYVVMDVIVPSLKDTIADVVSQGVERMIFGEARSSSRRTGNRPGIASGFVNYNRFSQAGDRGRREDPRSQLSQRARAVHNFDEVVLSTRAEAEEVIEGLFELVSKYEQATVADLYDLIGETSHFTDQNHGWRDIRGAGVVRVTNGYLLDLPRTEPLK
jgi:hypothetical protein